MLLPDIHYLKTYIEIWRKISSRGKILVQETKIKLQENYSSTQSQMLIPFSNHEFSCMRKDLITIWLLFSK